MRRNRPSSRSDGTPTKTPFACSPPTGSPSTSTRSETLSQMLLSAVYWNAEAVTLLRHGVVANDVDKLGAGLPHEAPADRAEHLGMRHSAEDTLTFSPSQPEEEKNTLEDRPRENPTDGAGLRSGA